MRKVEKEYFKTRNRSALEQSKAIEKEIDKEITLILIMAMPTGSTTSHGSKKHKEQEQNDADRYDKGDS